MMFGQKWWKVLISVIGGGVLTTANACYQAASSGGHCAFTFGNAVLPGLLVGVYGLLNLYSKPPHQP